MLPGDRRKAKPVHTAEGSRKARKDLLAWQEDFIPHPNSAMFLVLCVLNQATVTDYWAFHSSLMVADIQSSEGGKISK